MRFLLFLLGFLILSSCSLDEFVKTLQLPANETNNKTSLEQNPTKSSPVVLSKRIALVIGNAAYAEKPLMNPVNDANDMADALKKLGFEVILETEANLQTMRDALRDFEESLPNGSIGLFYFSGHGNQYNGDNYLIPLMATIRDERDFLYESIGTSRILEIMEDKNNEGVNLLFLDACRSNPYGSKRFKSSNMNSGLAPMVEQLSGSSLIAYATSPNKTADDNPNGRNAVYTKHLLTVLQEMPRRNIFTLLAEVRKRVKAETKNKQRPREDNALTVPDFCIALEGCESALLGEEEEKRRLAPDLRKQEKRPTVERQVEAKRLARKAEQLAREAEERQGLGDIISTHKQPLVKEEVEIPICSTDLKHGTICRDKLRQGGEGPKMVVIPAGKFQIGDLQGVGGDNEQPTHSVEVKQFLMGRYEVTFIEYDRFAESTGRRKPNDNGWGRENRPVVNVSWNDADAYTQWLSQQTGHIYRLPTEAEWEYAARAGTATNYWWGNTVSYEHANYGQDECCGGSMRGKDRWEFTAPIGSFEPNPFGLYDTVGNVWEWTCSRYTNRYDGNELECDVTNGGQRVLRGGSWFGEPKWARSAFRGNRSNLTSRNGYRGFRVVRIFH